MDDSRLLPSMTARIWLITGTTSGFGRRLVRSALSRGDKVIATGRSKDQLEELVKSSDPKWRDNLKVSQLDVTEGEIKLKEKVNEAAAFWGGIDVLVNNAGAGYFGILEEGGTTLLRRNLSSSVFGAMDMTTATAPYLRESKVGGTLIFIGSRSGWRPDRPGIGCYGAAKAAAHALAETYSVELAPFNVRTMIVAPGSFRTERMMNNEYYSENPIPVYDRIRNASTQLIKSVVGTQPGDPDKAMEVVVDVVRGEGVAKGRSWPLYLVLGEDAEQDVEGKCKKVLGILEEWGDVAKEVLYPDPTGAARQLHMSKLT